MAQARKANQKSGPWNKGKAPGQMAPFRRDQVRVIRTLLESEGAPRDLALFEVALSTMLRGCDLLRLTVEDVTDHVGEIRPEFPIAQRKTGQPHVVALSGTAQAALRAWIDAAPLLPGDYLFTSTRRREEVGAKPLTTQHFRRLVKKWAGYARLDPRQFSGHSLRRTKSAAIYAKTHNLRAVQELLGQKSIGSTAAYLGIDKRQALDLARDFEI